MDKKTKALAYQAIDENVKDSTARQIIRYVMECELNGFDTIRPTNAHIAKKYGWTLDTTKVAIAKAKRSQFIATTGRGKNRTFELNVQFLKGKMAEITAKRPLKRKSNLLAELSEGLVVEPNHLPNLEPNHLPNLEPNLEQGANNNNNNKLESYYGVTTSVNNESDDCAHCPTGSSHSTKNKSESDINSNVLKEKVKDVPSLDENRSEGAEHSPLAPHSSYVSNNPFGTAASNRSKGIEGYLAGLAKRMGLYASRNLRNTVKAYRLTKKEMEERGLDFASFMKAVEENITIQEASVKDGRVAISRLDDIFNKWDKVAEQLKSDKKWSDINLPDGWYIIENDQWYKSEKKRYMPANDAYKHADGAICKYDGWSGMYATDGYWYVHTPDWKHSLKVDVVCEMKKDGELKPIDIKVISDLTKGGGTE